MVNPQNVKKPDLQAQFPPSESCTCEICRYYCHRPGWWTVKQAQTALLRGWGPRMMLEVSPEKDIGVLSPAFKGNEGKYAYQEFSENGCTFFQNDRCELFATGLQPLECRFCHHDRVGEGVKCHLALELDWRSAEGQDLVRKWYRLIFRR